MPSDNAHGTTNKVPSLGMILIAEMKSVVNRMYIIDTHISDSFNNNIRWVDGHFNKSQCFEL